MTTIADIQAETQVLIAKATAETNARIAITNVVQGLQGQVATLQTELATAISQLPNGTDTAAFDQVSQALVTVASEMDANVAAEAALANTAPATPVSVSGTSSDASTTGASTGSTTDQSGATGTGDGSSNAPGTTPAPDVTQ